MYSHEQNKETYNKQEKETKKQITNPVDTTNYEMLRFDRGQSFRKPTFKECKGLSAVVTFKPGKDLVMGSVGVQLSRAKYHGMQPGVGKSTAY